MARHTIGAVVRGVDRGAEEEGEGGLDQRVTPVDRLAVSHLTQPAIVGRCPIAAVSRGRTRFSWCMQCSAQISKWLHDRLVC